MDSQCICMGLGFIAIPKGADVVTVDCPDCSKVETGLLQNERQKRLHPHHRNDAE